MFYIHYSLKIYGGIKLKEKLPNNVIESILKIVVKGYTKKWTEGSDGEAILTLTNVKKKKIATVILRNEEIEISGKEIEGLEYPL